MTYKIDTPALVIDEEIVRSNILKFQKFCDEKGVNFRPHIKTHKNVGFAKMQLEAGAVGINCQKISEAETLLDVAPFSDILITYNILGKDKLTRLKELSRRTKLSVVADSTAIVDGLAEIFNDPKSPLGVYVECDTGGQRCGVQTPQAAVALAQKIHNQTGLKLMGMMTYPRKGGTSDVDDFMRDVKEHAKKVGLKIENITSGGTPDMYSLSPNFITEYRAGTYIFNDYSLLKEGYVTLEECAARVHATVVSTPTPTRAIIDAGSKVLTSDMPYLESYGYIVGHEALKIATLSEEHGIIEGMIETGLQIGERIEIIPNHICVSVNMLDTYHVRNKNGDVRIEKINARGNVT